MRGAARLIVRALLVTTASVAGFLYLVGLSERMTRDMGACRVSHVYDGDTIAMACKRDGEVTARLAGLDTAETYAPRCDAERAHGALATDRLRHLVASGAVTMARLGEDKYGRPLIRLMVDGRDVAEKMIREGLAVAYDGGARVDWCKRLGAVE